jgi:hypothetical protein
VPKFTLDMQGDLISQLVALQAAIPARTQKACDVIAKLGAFYVAEEAPVASGGLAASIYWISATGENDYNMRSSEAAALGATILPSIPQPAQGASVGCAAKHGRPINDGFTHWRNNSVHIPANPFFSRGIGRARQEWGDVLREAIAGTLVDRS